MKHAHTLELQNMGSRACSGSSATDSDRGVVAAANEKNAIYDRLASEMARASVTVTHNSLDDCVELGCVPV